MSYYESMLEWEQELREQNEQAFLDCCLEAYSDGWDALRFNLRGLHYQDYLNEYMRGYNDRKDYEKAQLNHTPQTYATMKGSIS